MLYLVFKDLLIQRKTLVAAFVYILLFIVTFRNMGEGQLVATISAVAYLFIITGGSWDEKNNSDVLLNSFPIEKRKIVGAKYLAMPVYVAIAVIIYGMFSAVFSLVGFSVMATPLDILGITLGMLAVFIGCSFYFPVYFALGYTKSRYWYFILFFGGISTISILPQVLPERPLWLDRIIEGLAKITNDLVIWAILGAGVLVLVTLSYLISLSLYKRREF